MRDSWSYSVAEASTVNTAEHHTEQESRLLDAGPHR